MQQSHKGKISADPNALKYFPGFDFPMTQADHDMIMGKETSADGEHWQSATVELMGAE